MGERHLEDVLRYDFSTGTERFAQQLLADALAAIADGGQAEPETDKPLAALPPLDEAAVELDDEALEWLAAAGQPESLNDMD